VKLGKSANPRFCLPILGAPLHHPGEGELSGARGLKPRAIGTNKSHEGGDKQRWLLLLLIFFVGSKREENNQKQSTLLEVDLF